MELPPFGPIVLEFDCGPNLWGHYSAELVAIEGSKFRAVNAKERNFTPDQLKKLLAQIDERVEAYL
jgi:hypothetical protein